MFLLNFFINYAQNTVIDTINISSLSDNQVAAMIKQCWPNVKDTIYYGEYSDRIKYGYSRYEIFLDSNKIDFGPVLIMKCEKKTKMLSYEITEIQTELSQEIYQLVPPYQLFLTENKIQKNGTEISERIEKNHLFKWQNRAL